MGFEEFRDQVYARCARTDRGLVIFHSITSSHGSAQHVVREYRSEGSTPPATDLVAWRQTAGRGRENRTWSSPEGCGAYVSLIRPGIAVAAQTLPLRISVALCGELNRHLDGRCKVRWPNDLLVGRRKIGGILIDLVSQGDDEPVAVVSFGVNHTDDVQIFGEPRATGFCAEGGELGLVELVSNLVTAADRALDEPEEFPQVKSAYEELSSHSAGDELVVRGSNRKIEGRFRGFDDHGFLRLEVDGEERLISSGVVS